MSPPLEIVYASGCELVDYTGRRYIDAISSWWSVIHGYNHPALNAELTAQLSQFSHVMLGGLTHAPAQALAQKLVEITPKGLDHVFFSDSGSVGVEIALKMALGYWANVGRPDKRRFVALHGGYHGDTLAAMGVGDPQDGMHPATFTNFFTNFFLAPPYGFPATDHDISDALAQMERLFKSHSDVIAGLILEPILQGAGGFLLFDPRFLKEAKSLCEAYDILLIADEVASGFYRTGKYFACEWAEICPDLMIVGKGLTAGYLGHAATLATSQIYDSFLSDDAARAFMHGPTFMGNALACRVALKSIELLAQPRYPHQIASIEKQLKSAWDCLIDHPMVADVRILGAMGCIEVNDPSLCAEVQAYAIEAGIWLRPFGRFIYTMPAYTILPEQLNQVTNCLRQFFGFSSQSI